MKTLQDVLEGLREKHPGREVIVVQELMYMGTWPFLLRAPPPKGYDQFPKVINFSPAPLVLSSVDTAPFGPGLPPDSSVEGRARNAAMYASMKDLLADLTGYGNTVYGRLGATEKATGSLFDLWTTAGDITLQPCSPSLEYPRSDLPSTIRFIGGTPPNKVSLSTSLPAWWGELEINKQASDPKKVVFITQGTVAIDYDMLLIPAIQALADRDDVFVIAVLGAKGAKLDGFEVPVNAKVVDYLSYDAVLTYADAFVTNGGYGSFMHGVMHGVPMVMAGTTQDKAEVSMRGEWAGIAVNLRTDTPSREALRDGVDRILADSKFKIRCSEIQQENEELNCIAQVEKIITEME
ncbi:UDP-Glycosyltransferase/glycogen phosphorylase [Penicillium alfredii]|uniref:UDP-Glycosyltransferase/glycogen phosphorylase n=1 Tax=Penicillium alfredii TaxID=1506179 RepID=A0A9W9F111_9EURO|nr:UDP-Glycosyltransferase/glycogen phosphorylase [Penicillium alfredii]KAJ5091584.1 UDP-Glycosyltransferase/glycogen phosphorylase [Penicillium alfredii]